MRKFYILKKYENQGVKLPERQTTFSAGYDLAALEDLIINPKEIIMVKTGLKVQIPSDEVLLVFPRSSLGIKKGLTLANNVGVIDADYFNNDVNEGHIMMPVLNFKNKPVKIEKGERIAQAIFIKYFKTADDQQGDKKRVGGFGSSD